MMLRWAMQRLDQIAGPVASFTGDGAYDFCPCRASCGCSHYHPAALYYSCE
jgi:hypothetical protein